LTGRHTHKGLIAGKIFICKRLGQKFAFRCVANIQILNYAHSHILHYHTDRCVSYRSLVISKLTRQDFDVSVRERPIIRVVPETEVAKCKYSYFPGSVYIFNSTVQDVSLNAKVRVVKLTTLLHSER
jgi:hypothetical protein